MTKGTMKHIVSRTFQCTALALLAAALLVAPGRTLAQDSTNNPVAQVPVPKKHGLRFHGKVASVDATTMTFKVGALTLGITSATKLSKEGQPAMFSDISVGQHVSGAYKKDEAGKLNATSVRIGAPKKQNSPAPAAAPTTQ